MHALILAFVLSSEPVTLHLAWEGGGQNLPVQDAQATGTDAPNSPDSATETTQPSSEVAESLNSVCRCGGDNRRKECSCYSCNCTGSVAANGPAASSSRGEVAASPPGADTTPALTIRVAPFYCAPCNLLKTYDWSAFDVTWETGGDVERGYPEVSWTDSRGTKRWLAGAYRPDQVKWSMERTP